MFNLLLPCLISGRNQRKLIVGSLASLGVDQLLRMTRYLNCANYEITKNKG